MTTQWKLIETAPRDGSRVLVRDEPDQVYIARWTDDVWLEIYGEKGGQAGWISDTMQIVNTEKEQLNSQLRSPVEWTLLP